MKTRMRINDKLTLTSFKATGEMLSEPKHDKYFFSITVVLTVNYRRSANSIGNN